MKRAAVTARRPRPAARASGPTRSQSQKRAACCWPSRSTSPRNRPISMRCVAWLAKGCRLLPSGVKERRQTTERTTPPQAVIFLLEHDDRGSLGLILNKPTSFKMSTIRGCEVLCPEFAEQQLFLGGDCDKGTLFSLHPFPAPKVGVQTRPCRQCAAPGKSLLSTGCRAQASSGGST